MSVIKKVLENLEPILEMDSVIWDMISMKSKILYYVKNDLYDVSQLEERYNQIKSYRKQLRRLQKIPKIEQRTEKWYNARAGIITASNFYAAMNKRKSFIDKKARNDTTNSRSVACEWGVKYEPIACEIYRHVNSNINVYDFGLILDKEISCIGASPDGITDLGIMVEIKCPYSKDIRSKEIKTEYWYQVQGQMAICGLKECDFSQFQFKEFKSKDDFLEQFKNYKYFGVIVGGDTYSVLGTCEYDIDTVLKSVDTTDTATYWVLDTYNIQRIGFDKDLWDTQMLPSLLECWKEIEVEKNRYLPSGFLKDECD